MRDLTIALCKKDFQVAIYSDRRAGPRSLIASNEYLDVYKDFEQTIEELQRQQPQTNIYAVGISYGTSVMVDYLANRATNSVIKGAVAVSSPFDFYLSKEVIKHKHFNFYEQFIVKQYKNMLIKNKRDWLDKKEGKMGIDIDRVLEVQSLDELDEVFHKGLTGVGV